MIVFVHGNPETAAVWDDVRGHLDRPSIAVSLPGFGCARPAGFGATKDDYVASLLEELDRIEGPIDLVGHDWGAGFTYRIATAHGDRLRSWVGDVGHLFHPRYEWHAFAQIWQTPGEGEAFMAAQNALSPEERAPVFESMGVPPAQALAMAAASDATMGGCILDLYRSAMPNPYVTWGPWSPTHAPGLVLDPCEDALGDATLAAEVASSLGARFEPIEGAGHFWPCQAPAAGAALLEAFWSTI